MNTNKISKEKLSFTIDLLIAMTVKEIADTTDRDTNKVLPEFLTSKTGKALLDESNYIWHNGPSYIANIYFDEIANSKK